MRLGSVTCSSALYALPAAALLAAGALSSFGCSRGSYSFCEEWVKKQCAYEFSCCKDDERLERHAFFRTSLQYVNSEGECVDRSVPALCTGQRQNDDSIALGRMEVDVEAQDECLEKMQAAIDDCDIEDFLTARDAKTCSDTTNPLVDDKDECGLNGECKSGVCEVERDEDGVAKDYNDETDAPEGECLKLPSKGEECEAEDGFRCAVGLYCDLDLAGSECKELEKKGDSCDGNEQCASGVCNDNECDDESDVDLDDKFCEGKE